MSRSRLYWRVVAVHITLFGRVTPRSSRGCQSGWRSTSEGKRHASCNTTAPFCTRTSVVLPAEIGYPGLTLWRASAGVGRSAGIVAADVHRIGDKNPAATFLTQVARIDSVERVGHRSGLYRQDSGSPW